MTKTQCTIYFEICKSWIVSSHFWALSASHSDGDGVMIFLIYNQQKYHQLPVARFIMTSAMTCGIIKDEKIWFCHRYYATTHKIIEYHTAKTFYKELTVWFNCQFVIDLTMLMQSQISSFNIAICVNVIKLDQYCTIFQ